MSTSPVEVGDKLPNGAIVIWRGRLRSWRKRQLILCMFEKNYVTWELQEGVLAFRQTSMHYTAQSLLWAVQNCIKRIEAAE